MQPADDPGWGPVLRGAWRSFVPFVGIRRVRRGMEAGADALHTLRVTFVAFAAAIVHIGVVVAIFAAGDGFEGGDLPAPPVLLGVAAWGVGSVLGVRALHRLDCSSQEALLGTYRTRFFLRLAVAETAALVGFVGFLLTMAPLAYVVGALFAAAGFALLAPTAANLARDQYRLDQARCPHNLVALLQAVRLSDTEPGE